MIRQLGSEEEAEVEREADGQPDDEGCTASLCWTDETPEGSRLLVGAARMRQEGRGGGAEAATIGGCVVSEEGGGAGLFVADGVG